MEKNQTALLIILILIVIIIFGGIGGMGMYSPMNFIFGTTLGIIAFIVGVLFWVLVITALVLLIMWLSKQLKEDKKFKGEVKRKIHSFADAI